jgi:hypothetical protein
MRTGGTTTREWGLSVTGLTIQKEKTDAISHFVRSWPRGRLALLACARAITGTPLDRAGWIAWHRHGRSFGSICAGAILAFRFARMGCPRSGRAWVQTGERFAQQDLNRLSRARKTARIIALATSKLHSMR